MAKKVCLITGAARGIGLATVNLFLDNSFLVVMVDRDSDELEKISGSLEGVYPIVCDVSQEDDVKNLFNTVIRAFW